MCFLKEESGPLTGWRQNPLTTTCGTQDFGRPPQHPTGLKTYTALWELAARYGEALGNGWPNYLASFVYFIVSLSSPGTAGSGGEKSSYTGAVPGFLAPLRELVLADLRIGMERSCREGEAISLLKPSHSLVPT